MSDRGIPEQLGGGGGRAPDGAAERRLALESGILAAIADAVVATDEAGRIGFWNPGAERIFGLARDQALDASWEVMFTTGRASDLEPLREAVRDERFWEGDVRVGEPDGVERVLEVVSYPFPADPEIARVSLVWDVTGQRAATQAVGRLAAIVEQADDAIYTIDRDGVVLTWNGGAERLTGYAAAEMIGRRGPFAEPAEVKDDLRRRGFEQGEFIKLHATHLRAADGTLIPVDLSVSPVRDGHGRVVALSAVARDERPRLEAEQVLRFRDAILAALDDAVVATDDALRLVFWSPGAERLFGIPATEALGRPMAEVVPMRVIGATEGGVLADLAEGQPVRLDAEYTRPDGSTFIGETHATTMQGRDGRSTGLAVIRDVTSVRQAAADGARLAAIVEGAADIIIGTGLDAVVRSWNPAAERVLGYTAEEMAGRTIATYIAPEFLPQAFRLRAELTQEGRPSAAAEFTYLTRDGERIPVWVVIAPIRDGAGSIVGVSAIAHDLRARKSLEDQLRQAQKLEAVGRLAGGIAHDFNNLLTAIIGSASLILTDADAAGAASEDAARILEAAERAATLTRSLLAFSRGMPREPRVLALDDLVTGLGPMLRRLLPAHVDLVLEAASGTVVEADPTELELVLVNLVVNAAEAMPGGGRVAVSTRARTLDPAFADAHLGVRPGPHAELVVADAGMGMTEEVRTRLFEPFFSTKTAKGGTGLGLATVHGYVEAAGGTIWVESAPGEGSTFRILLPALDAAPAAAPAAGRMAPRGGRERILVVEDDPGVRTLVGAVLRRAGYHVAVAEDPAVAATMDPADWDLVLTDVVMPRLDGPTLAARLRTRRPDLRVLFMSGYAEQVEGAPEVTPLLPKPFGQRELLEAVRRLLDEPA